MGLLDRRQNPQFIAEKCINGHIYVSVVNNNAGCYFCTLKHALDAGTMLNRQHMELSGLIKDHVDQWFKYLEENPNDVIIRGAARQSVEILVMLERHAQEREEARAKFDL